MAPQSSYIVMRKDFPAFPRFSLPIYPRSCGIDCFDSDTKAVIPGLTRDFVQVNWVIAGTGYLGSATQHRSISRGDVFLQYPHEQDNQVIMTPGLTIRWLTFDGNQAAAFMRSYGYRSLLRSCSANLEAFFLQFEKSLRELTADGMRQAVAMVTALLATLGANQPEETPPALVQRFRQAAENFYGDTTCDVTMLCAYLRVPRGTLSRLFHESGNGSPGHCLREIRVRHALELLALGTSVAETSRQCGFLSPTYFSQAIRRITGLTPKHFQQWK